MRSFTLDAVRELASRDNPTLPSSRPGASKPAASQIAQAGREAQVETDIAKSDKELTRQQELAALANAPA